MPKTREERLEYYRKYYQDNKDKWGRNREKLRSQQRIANDKLRLKTIQFMGGKCVRCKFNDHRALQFDHIHRLPANERRKSGRQLCNDVLAHPEKFQLLCANCNWIKRWENREYTRRFEEEDILVKEVRKPEKKIEEFFER